MKLSETLPLYKVFNSNNSDPETSIVDRVASVAKLAHLVIADLSVCRQR